MIFCKFQEVITQYNLNRITDFKPIGNISVIYNNHKNNSLIKNHILFIDEIVF